MANPIFLDRNEAHRRIVALGEQFGFEIDPDAKVETLSVGWQQRVEILKALYRKARILVLDEPTAVLTPQETEEIFAVLRRLAAEGHSIIFISHKLYEVLEIADRITVIRRGRVVGERIPSETNEDDLAELMVGRDVAAHGRSRRVAPGRRRACRSTASGPRTTAAARSSAASTSRSGPARSSASPASPATARTSSSRRSPGLRKPTGGTVTLGGADVTGWSAAPALRGGPRLRPRRPPSLGLSELPARGQPRPDRATTGRRSPAGSSARTRRSTPGRSELIAEFDIRTPSATVAAEHPVRRQPAEGRRRPRVQRRPEAARARPADARPRRRAASSSSTARRSPSATPARRSCSSRPSSTRSSSCPTGSRSCTAARSWRSLDGRTAEQGGDRPAHGHRTARHAWPAGAGA